ncbi:MAG TPA: sugar ABC transporter permease [Thermomicrobiales bacterium]|jgi:multiple sugar transport system permease protein|nr:sugar ABC transporter permease [Thermomicrobiales bacterium]
MVSMSFGRSGPGPSRSAADREDRYLGWLFILPALLVIVTFIVGPIIYAAWVSFFDWDTIGQFGEDANRPFIGLDNYRELFNSPQFYQALRNTTWYTIGVVPLQTIFALLLALLANRKIRGLGFFRTAFYFPSISSSVVIAVIFIWIYSGNGLINTVLRNLGIDPPRPVWLSNPNGIFAQLLGKFGIDGVNVWLEGPSIAMASIMAQNIWTSLGGLMVIYLAGLQNIPRDVYEAASLDGASRWQTFRDITVPLLRPITYFVLTIGMIGCFQVFDQIYIMSEGGPAGTTTTLAYLVYTQGFQGFRLGYASAISIVLFFIILVVFLLQRRIDDQGQDQ